MIDRVRFELDCDEATQLEIREVLKPLLFNETDARFVERRNLDGDVPTWIVIATLAANSLPHVLKFIIDWRKGSAVERIKVDKVEITNPTKEQVNSILKELDLSGSVDE